MKNPKVSIIIPTYNMAEYIEEAIKSIIRQTLKDFEIIVVDDGSTDETEEVLKSLLEKHNVRIKIIKNKRSPYALTDARRPSKARNKALKYAKGKYVLFFDADNIMRKDMLKKEVEILEKKKNVAFVYSDFCKFKDVKFLFFNLRIKKLFKSKPFSFETLLQDNYIDTSSLVRRKVFDEVGSFRENLQFCEEYDLWFRILLRGYKPHYISEPLYYYRLHKKQLSRDKIIVEEYTRKVKEKYKKCVQNMKLQ